MFLHTQLLINEIVPDEPDPAAANALQEGLGGQFGELRTMMQYLMQSFNFRGAAAKPYRDLLYGVGTEEIGHVELIATTIARLTDGSPRYQGKATDPLDKAAEGGKTPLASALGAGNIHHFLVGAQGALLVDAAGNPWSGSYVYNSGNLVLDLLYNLMLESTGRLQKCRLYEMTDNKMARSTIAYLIVRDQAHENAYAKALESLGVNWGAALPIPRTDAERYPEVKVLLDQGLHLKQYTFSADNLSEAGKVFRGSAPASMGGGTLTTEQMPKGAPMDIAVERPEEFSPGLDPELLELVQATAELELADAESPGRVRSAAGGTPRSPPSGSDARRASRSPRNPMSERNTLVRSLHDLGLAAWFGGTLAGAVGINGAAADVRDRTDRLPTANAGWARWAPVNLVAIGAHLIGGAGLLQANSGRVATQRGASGTAALKGALTVAALGVTAYSRVLGKKLEQAGRTPVEGGTDPAPDTSEEVAKAQRQLKVTQWVIPALTGGIVVLTSVAGEQQKPSQQVTGVLGRVLGVGKQ